MLQLFVPSAQAMVELGRRIGKILRPGDVLGLVGDLGTGKTTLVQGIARGLDIEANITSPTFTLIKQYSGRLTLYHIDVYRLDDPEEILLLGIDEILLQQAVVAVEWADKVEEILPKNHLRIEIQLAGKTGRNVFIDGRGKDLQELSEELKTVEGVVIR